LLCAAEQDCDEEGDIDPSLNGLAQDDETLIEALKNYYLDAPANDFPYKIDPNRLRAPAIHVSLITQIKCLFSTIY
jgi:hypothetical protein